MTKHFLTLNDLGKQGLHDVLAQSHELKRLRGTPTHPTPLAGKSVALIFEKHSTRTRLSFVVGVHELGGNPIATSSSELQITRGEPLADTARMLSRYVHAVVYRTSSHNRLIALRDNCAIPVINGLSDLHHPCQLLADLQTVQEATHGRLEGVRVAWLGDGNNMAHSWIEAAALTGIHLTLACPQGYQPNASILAKAQNAGFGKVTLTHDADEAVRGADVVTTDVWASMGQESESEGRHRAFEAYAVTDERMRKASANAIFLHCLPAHRGEEVEASVIDGAASRVWDEAENRLHAQKALLAYLMQDRA